MNKLLFVILIGITVSMLLPSVHAQQPTQQILERLSSEGKNNCEVWQINDFLYTPVRINLVNEPVNKYDVTVVSEDPSSEVFWEGSKQTFQLVTSSTDRHTVEIILDYELKEDKPRQVFYQVYAEDNTLMMEGNWVHEGFTFCKVIEFFAQPSPHILTPEEIQEENNKFNSDFRTEQQLSNTSIQNGILLLGVIFLVVGVIIGLIFFVIIIALKSMGRIAKKPVKKLEDMIELVRAVIENLKLIGNNMIQTDSSTKKEILKQVKNSNEDLSIVVQGVKQEFDIIIKDLKNVTSKTKQNIIDKKETINNVINTEEKNKHDIITDNIEPNTVEEERVNEESMEELYLGKNNVVLDEDIIEDVDENSEEIKNNETFEEDIDYIEMDVKDVKPCFVCLENPNVICSKCEKMFCNEHQSHVCKKTEEGDNILSNIKNKASRLFFEIKIQKITNIKEVRKALSSGKSEEQIEVMLIAEYLKIPRDENIKTYDDMQKKSLSERSPEFDIMVMAMLKALNKQV